LFADETWLGLKIGFGVAARPPSGSRTLATRIERRLSARSGLDPTVAYPLVAATGQRPSVRMIPIPMRAHGADARGGLARQLLVWRARRRAFCRGSGRCASAGGRRPSRHCARPRIPRWAAPLAMLPAAVARPPVRAWLQTGDKPDGFLRSRDTELAASERSISPAAATLYSGRGNKLNLIHINAGSAASSRLHGGKVNLAKGGRRDGEADHASEFQGHQALRRS
jgi:hypothetical protein